MGPHEVAVIERWPDYTPHEVVVTERWPDYTPHEGLNTPGGGCNREVA